MRRILTYFALRRLDMALRGRRKIRRISSPSTATAEEKRPGGEGSALASTSSSGDRGGIEEDYSSKKGNEARK